MLVKLWVLWLDKSYLYGNLKILKIIFYLVLILSINFKAEINVEPGELFAIKLSDCPKLIKEDELFIEHNNTEYVILPASYTTKDIRLNQYCTPVRINKTEKIACSGPPPKTWKAKKMAV